MKPSVAHGSPHAELLAFLNMLLKCWHENLSFLLLDTKAYIPCICECARGRLKQSAVPCPRPFPILARPQETRLLRITARWESRRQGRGRGQGEGEGKGGDGGNGVAAILFVAPLCALFSVTHASPSPPLCLGLCIARRCMSAGAAPGLQWTPL